MRISRLSLKNFRSHAETAFEFDRITILRGPNAAGKTTILHALEWLLTNRVAQVTDEAGRNSDRLMTTGATEFSISADIFEPEIGEEDAGRITRNKSRNGMGIIVQAPDFSTPDRLGEDAEKWIREQIGPQDQIRVLLNSGRFISMSEKEQAALLIAALAGKSVAIPKAIQDAMRAACGSVIANLANDADAEKVHAEYYKLRTAFNRDVKSFGELKAPEIPADMPDSASVSSKLTLLRSERDGLVNSRTRKLTEAQSKGALDKQNKLNALENERAEIVRQWEQKAAQLKQALADIKIYKAAILEDDELERLNKIVSKTQTYRELQESHRTLMNQLAAIDRDRLQLQSKKDSKKPAVCPTCGQKIAAEDLEPQIAAKEKERERTAESLAHVSKQIDFIGGEPGEASAKVEAHKKACIAIAPAEKIARDLKSLPTQPDTKIIDFNIKQLKEMPVEQAETPDTSDLDAKIKDVETRIAKGETVLSQITLLEGERKQYEQAAAKLTAAREKADKADIVVKAFEPGGAIRAELIGDAAETFKARLIESLARFDFTCNFSLHPYTFTVESMEISQLCESEKFRFGVAFQVALAEATGINFVCIDRSDVLVSEEMRGELAGLLMQSRLDQAIAFLASPNPQALSQPLPDGVRFIDLVKVDGKTQVSAVYRAQ